MKINLAENMLRFGAKNLTESSKQKLEQLAEQTPQGTSTTTPIQIKSSAGSLFNVTPGVKLDGVNGKLVLDFVKNTVKLNEMEIAVADLVPAGAVPFGIIKQLCMVWGATGEVNAKTWGPRYKQATAAINLFSADKNIPSSFRVKFKEFADGLRGVQAQQTKELMIDTPAGKRIHKIDTNEPLSVTSQDAGMLHYMMQLNPIN